MIDEDEWKKTNNFLMFPLKLIRPGVTGFEVIQAAAAHWGSRMDDSERESLAEEYVETAYNSHDIDVNLDEEMSEAVAAGLEGLGYSLKSIDPARDLSPRQKICKGDAIIRIRQDYFESWVKKRWSDRFFTTVCAILSKVGGKNFCPMTWQEIAARQVGSTEHLDKIKAKTMSRQVVRTQVNKILEKGILSRAVYHKRISYYSCKLGHQALGKAILEYKCTGAMRKGVKYQLDANHFNRC